MGVVEVRETGWRPMTSRRTWLVAAGVSLVLVGCGAPQPGGPTEVPESTGATPAAVTAPDFSLPTLYGDTVRLSDHLGKKVILIDFWSTTCDPCLLAMPQLVALYEKHKSQGFIVLAVSVDGPETLAQVRAVVHDKKMSFPVLLDEETDVMARYNPKRELPFTVVISRSGSIVHKRGGHDGTIEAVIAVVEQALADS